MSQLDPLLAAGDEIGAAGARKARAPGSVPSGVTKAANAQLRKTFVGIPVTTVPASSTVDLTCNVLEPFRMDRPYLSRDAQNLHVLNIRTGTKPLNVSPNPISGNVFAENAIGNELSGYTAQPGTGITLTLVNTATGSESHVASGGFLGWAAL
jgi:hypothetical protein